MGVLPPEVEEVMNAALVAELTVLDDRGRAVTHPLIPLYDGEKILMTSSVLFSRKLERIKANPKVSVSVTDPVSAVGRRAVPADHDPGRRDGRRRRPPLRVGAVASSRCGG